jgi:hypothetical protein
MIEIKYADLWVALEVAEQALQGSDEFLQTIQGLRLDLEYAHHAWAYLDHVTVVVAK